jgi:bifunctional non-homologous end joining protein LigD
MLVVLDERAAEDWMKPRERDLASLKRRLVPAPLDLLAIRPASPLLNSVKNERVRRSSRSVVEFLEWTPDNHLRHPKFIALREDKLARAVIRERC